MPISSKSSDDPSKQSKHSSLVYLTDKSPHLLVSLGRKDHSELRLVGMVKLDRIPQGSEKASRGKLLSKQGCTRGQPGEPVDYARLIANLKSICLSQGGRARLSIDLREICGSQPPAIVLALMGRRLTSHDTSQ